MKKLKGISLIMFKNDTMVVPKESSWFGFYAPGQSNKVLPYEKTNLYQEVSLFYLHQGNSFCLFLSSESDKKEFMVWPHWSRFQHIF